MSEAIVAALPALAAAFFYTSHPGQPWLRAAFHLTPRRARVLRALALMLAVLGCVLYRTVEPGPAAILAPVVTWMASATVCAVALPWLAQRFFGREMHVEPLERLKRPRDAGSRRSKHARLIVVSRVTVAVLGTLPAALLWGAALARFLPLSADARYAIAFVATIPCWLLAMCLAFGSSLRTSWIACAALTGVLALLVFGMRVP